MAKKTQEGVIATVSGKDFTDKQTGEPIVLHSFQLQGSNRWFRTGTDPVPFKEGTGVKFVVDGQNVDVKTMEATNSAPAPAPSKGAQSAKSGVSRDEYWANKEKRDLERETRYQNVDIPRMTMSTAVQAATTVVSSAVEQGILGFGNAAKAKRLDMLTDYVEQVADRLYVKITTTPDNPPVSEEKSAAPAASSNDDNEGEEDD